MTSNSIRTLALLPLLGLVLATACKKEEPAKPATPPQATEAAKPAPPPAIKVGLVTDVGGRGDHSFNDSALRGLELWAGGKTFNAGGYQDATPEEIKASFSADIAARQPPVTPLGIQPLVLQSKAQEDYQPNLQLLVDQGAKLSVGVGFMLENAVEAIATSNPGAQFLLIDSPLVDAKNNPYTLPNVRAVTFKEEQGSFLVGALAGLATKTNKVGFVGGMEVPLIKKFEAGYRAGVMTTNPKATIVANYTGSFDNVSAGKQVGQDMAAKGADVIYQAAGADGLGVIQAVKEARAAGKQVFVIGVDSDQSHLAPDAVLTSMLKRVDLAIYESARDLAQSTFKGGDVAMGIKEGGISMAEVKVDFPNKAEALAKVEALRQKIISGELVVPTNLDALKDFKPAP
jgi:basic membrane protein A